MPCSRPGCVAEARTRGLCPVHAHADGGEVCTGCHGGGTVKRVAEGTRNWIDEACGRCGGCGFVDKARRAGSGAPRTPVAGRDLMRLMDGDA